MIQKIRNTLQEQMLEYMFWKRQNGSDFLIQVGKLEWLVKRSFGGNLGGVYMRKLAPARVLYRHDFLISYRVYMMTGLFHISLFEGTLHVDIKCMCDF